MSFLWSHQITRPRPDGYWRGQQVYIHYMRAKTIAINTTRRTYVYTNPFLWIVRWYIVIFRHTNDDRNLLSVRERDDCADGRHTLRVGAQQYIYIYMYIYSRDGAVTGCPMSENVVTTCAWILEREREAILIGPRDVSSWRYYYYYYYYCVCITQCRAGCP